MLAARISWSQWTLPEPSAYPKRIFLFTDQSQLSHAANRKSDSTAQCRVHSKMMPRLLRPSLNSRLALARHHVDVFAKQSAEQAIQGSARWNDVAVISADGACTRVCFLAANNFETQSGEQAQ
jgi:hypothetical protein